MGLLALAVLLIVLIPVLIVCGLLVSGLYAIAGALGGVWSRRRARARDRRTPRPETSAHGRSAGRAVDPAIQLPAAR